MVLLSQNMVKIKVNQKQPLIYVTRAERQIKQIIMIEPITTLESGNGSKVWCVDWHPKQDLLASVGEDKSISLWKRSSNHQQWHKTQSIMTQHLKTIRCIRFSHKGDKIAICSFDSLISIYILNEANYQFLTQLQGHQNQVKCIDWHETDKKIASCSRDKNIWIWGFNPTTYEYECENILEGHTNDVKFVKWIDYGTLVSCGYDDTIRVWCENDDDFQQFQVLKTHDSIVWSLDFRNNFLISSSTDKSVTIFKRNQDSLKFQMFKRIKNLHQQPIYSVFIAYPYFITAAGDNAIKLWREEEKEVDSCKEICSAFHQNDVNCIRLKKTDVHFLMASCSDDATIKIWKVII